MSAGSGASGCDVVGPRGPTVLRTPGWPFAGNRTISAYSARTSCRTAIRSWLTASVNSEAPCVAFIDSYRNSRCSWRRACATKARNPITAIAAGSTSSASDARSARASVIAISTTLETTTVDTNEIATGTGSRRMSSEPSAIAMATVTRTIPVSDPATEPSMIPAQPANPNASPSPATERNTISATAVVSASWARLNTSFAARWRLTSTSALAAPTSVAPSRPPGESRYSPSTRPTSLERDGVLLTPELEMDDVGLGEIEDERERPPGHRRRDDRGAVHPAQDEDPERNAGHDEGSIEQPDRSDSAARAHSLLYRLPPPMTATATSPTMRSCSPPSRARFSAPPHPRQEGADTA